MIRKGCEILFKFKGNKMAETIAEENMIIHPGKLLMEDGQAYFIEAVEERSDGSNVVYLIEHNCFSIKYINGRAVLRAYDYTETKSE